MNHCQHCQRNVKGTKPIGGLAWLAIIVLSGVTFGVFLVFFLLWYFFIKKPECPICGATDLQKQRLPIGQ
ncbi:MAG: hypothetical protein ABI210_12925 [Abditibacteriaceae bacterium]